MESDTQLLTIQNILKKSPTLGCLFWWNLPQKYWD